jgi:hypothetical protein
MPSLRGTPLMRRIDWTAMISRLLRRALPAAVLLAAASAAPALAEHPKALLAHTPSGGQPNAPAQDPAISKDGRMDRYAAYDSAATDITPGANGHRNVYLVKRAGAITRTGTPWQVGATTLVSKGYNGPADNDSWGPAFDGYDYVHAGREITVTPKCLAFVSAADNLVRGDTDGHADVFLKRLPSGKLKRIATPGAATDVALDGRCWYMAYVAGGSLYLKNLRSGGVKRIAGGQSSSPELSANGKITVFSRNGSVYVNRQGGGGTHRVGTGILPSGDEWGRYVAYQSGSDVWVANTQGSPQAHVIAAGAAPSMTAGGHFVFYVTAAIATSNVYRAFGTCPGGSVAQQIAGSPHGNYAAFSCASGALFLSYIGPK